MFGRCSIKNSQLLRSLAFKKDFFNVWNCLKYRFLGSCYSKWLKVSLVFGTVGRCGGKRRAQTQWYFTIRLPAASCEKVPALNCKMIRFVKLNLRQLGQKAEYFFSMKKWSKKEESPHGNFGLLCSSNKKTPPLDTSETRTQCFFCWLTKGVEISFSRGKDR